MKQQEINKLLDEYRKGTISSENRQLLEQLSVEDDFVFDALEGMNESVKGKGEVRDLDILRGRLEKRVGTQKERKMAWWIPSAAAAVLLVLGGMWLFQDDSISNESSSTYAEAKQAKKEGKGETFDLESQENESVVADTDDSGTGSILEEEASFNDIEENAGQVVSESVVVKDREKKEIARIEERQEERIENDVPVATTATTASVPSTKPTSAQAGNAIDGVQVDNSSILEDVVEETFEDESVEEEFQGDLNTEYSPERAQQAEADMVKVEKKKAILEAPPALQNTVYNGVITDNYGQPLIGAVVKIKGRDNVYMTDLDGRVDIRDITMDNPRAIISYTGFNTIEIPLTKDFRVTLNEGELLDEVVVVSNARKKFKQKQLASPNMGWIEFHSKVTQQTGKSNTTLSNASIIIEFKVNLNGIPKKFKVVKGLNTPETELIIEMIKAEKWSKGDGKVMY